jgi:hypothetical protein
MSMAATHKFAFTMVDGHSCSYTMEGLLPRATINAHNAPSMTGHKGGQVTSASGNFLSLVPGQSGTAPASALLFAWMLWCSPVPLSSWFIPISLHFEEGAPGTLLFYVQIQSQSALAPALLFFWEPWCNPTPFSSWLIKFLLQPLCTFIHSSATMVRKRGRPHRGSVWYAHKAQRQWKEKLEHALAIVTSTLQKKAWAEKLALLATIAETGAGGSREAMAIKPGDRQDVGAEDEFPTCYVEEDPFMEDLSTAQEPRATEVTHRDESRPNLAQEDDILGCIVEETPWRVTTAPPAIICRRPVRM